MDHNRDLDDLFDTYDMGTPVCRDVTKDSSALNEHLELLLDADKSGYHLFIKGNADWTLTVGALNVRQDAYDLIFLGKESEGLAIIYHDAHGKDVGTIEFDKKESTFTREGKQLVLTSHGAKVELDISEDTKLYSIDENIQVEQ